MKLKNKIEKESTPEKLSKIKKLVQKEEEIALAYKKYLLEKGENPATFNVLKTATVNNSTTETYLPKGFDVDSVNEYIEYIKKENNNIKKENTGK